MSDDRDERALAEAPFAPHGERAAEIAETQASVTSREGAALWRKVGEAVQRMSPVE